MSFAYYIIIIIEPCGFVNFAVTRHFSSILELFLYVMIGMFAYILLLLHDCVTNGVC